MEKDRMFHRREPSLHVHHVCIDGVLYYPARKFWGDKDYIIVCFDVRSETFRCVKDTDGYTRPFRSAPMVNFNGKLASLGPEETVDGSCESNRLRVLEDVETGEWSERTFVLPEVWKSVVGRTFVRFVGVTRSDEIVLYSSSLQYLVYYNTERNTVVRVDIQGMEAFMGFQIFTLQDHIEDVRLTKV
ncbi:F-box protein At5g65850 [Brassica rapa]|uniref:F-box protein At5g65850 n=1 Tax=Brassica campestris TaxID=3711 RepID=UPI0004F1A346|nr:F-box protein At5g65850 [Brassica rapa]